MSGHMQASVIEVIEVTSVKGNGVGVPYHVTADYFSLTGQLLATSDDPGSEATARHFERGNQHELQNARVTT